MSLARQVIETATETGVTVALAESCTGGMVSAALTDIAGSSAVLDRGFVTYSNAAKQEMLGVSAATLAAFGAVSEPVAREMALGALTRSGARIAVSITGIAGPGGSGHKPEGRVCFATATAQGVSAETVEFGPIGRGKVRRAATDHALGLLLSALGHGPARP